MVGAGPIGLRTAVELALLGYAAPLRARVRAGHTALQGHAAAAARASTLDPTLTPTVTLTLALAPSLTLTLPPSPLPPSPSTLTLHSHQACGDRAREPCALLPPQCDPRHAHLILDCTQCIYCSHRL